MKNRYLKYLAILFLVPILQACPPVFCEPKTINYPPLSEETLSFVPYKYGDSLLFVHSGGTKIAAHCTRIKTRESDGCSECCTQNSYEIDNTTITFDYPISEFIINLSSFDSVHVELYVFFNPSSINYPVGLHDMIKDSMLIDGKIYTQVYTLPFYSQSYYSGEYFRLFADSLYYNSAYGVIKICMSNGEYFTRYED